MPDESKPDAKRDGLTLFEDTLKDATPNSIALGRVLASMYAGGLSIHGQLPDKDYPVAEHLIHGGRIKFDLNGLSEDEQQEFFDFVTNKIAVPRDYATHRFGDDVDPEGSPKEVKSGAGGFFSDAVRSAKTPVHYGIDLAIGGRTTPCREGSPLSLGKNPQEDGQWGHLYIHRDTQRKTMLFGIEGGGPKKHNIRTNQAHSVVGSPGEFSAFCELKGTSNALHEEQQKQGKTPINIGQDINWATVKVTKGTLELLRSGSILPLDIVRSPHPLSEPAKPDRLQAMLDWNTQKLTVSGQFDLLLSEVKNKFSSNRFFKDNKAQYDAPLANLNQALHKYRLPNSSVPLEDRYALVVQALDKLRDKSVTSDAGKIAAVDALKAQFEKLHVLESRHLKEDQLSGILMSKSPCSAVSPLSVRKGSEDDMGMSRSSVVTSPLSAGSVGASPLSVGSAESEDAEVSSIRKSP